jgi:hypothetical protein
MNGGRVNRRSKRVTVLWRSKIVPFIKRADKSRHRFRCRPRPLLVDQPQSGALPDDGRGKGSPSTTGGTGSSTPRALPRGTSGASVPHGSAGRASTPPCRGSMKTTLAATSSSRRTRVSIGARSRREGKNRLLTGLPTLWNKAFPDLGRLRENDMRGRRASSGSANCSSLYTKRNIYG